MNDSYSDSPPSIKASKTFDLGSDSDLTDEPMTEEGLPFPSESYLSPPRLPSFGVAPPSNIFNNVPESSVTFFSDMTGAPQLPDYLTDEEDMDLECCDNVNSGSIMILPRYSVWQPESPYLSLKTSPAMPSLYSSSDDEEEEAILEEDDDEVDQGSDCSTVPSLPCMATVRRERAARRAVVGKKALLKRASSEEHKAPSMGLNLEGAQAASFVAFAA